MVFALRKLSPRGHRAVRPRSGSIGPTAARGAYLLAALGLLLGALLPAKVAIALPVELLLAADRCEEAARELERTDRIIERAREQVQEGWATQRASVTTQAQALLQSAARLQGEARKRRSEDRQESCRQASTLTLTARNYAIRAIELSQVEFKAHENLQSLLEQTREMVVETSDEVQSTGNPEAAHLLQMGEDQLRRADEAYRERKFRQAIRLAVVSRDLIRRAQDIARGTGPGGFKATESALERTDALLTEVGDAIREESSAEDIQTHYKGAKELQERARRAFRNGRLPRANLLTRMARERALSILVRIQASPSKEDLEAGLALLEELYADLRGVAQESGDDKALKFLEQGQEHLVKARRALDSGEVGQALRETRAAEAFLRKISDRLPEL